MNSFSADELLTKIANNDVEKAILHTCISYGFVGVGTIARYTNYPRATLYDHLNRMVQTGYIITQIGSRGTLYGLAPISSIHTILHGRIDQIQEQIDLFDNLGSMIQANKFIGTHIPKVVYHEGIAAIKSIHGLVLTEDNMMGFFDPEAAIRSGLYTESELLECFSPDRGYIRDILIDSDLARKCRAYNGDKGNAHIVLADLPCRDFDMLIINDTVYHMSFHNPLVMIEIRSQVYCDVQKIMFDTMWSSLGGK